MPLNSIKYQTRQYTNFFGNDQQFCDEISNPVIIREESEGVCWLSFKNSIYYMSYCVDDLAILSRFIDFDLAEIAISHGVLLELKYKDANTAVNQDILIDSLIKNRFNKQSHHIAYIKNYFKKSGETDSVVRLDQKNIADLYDLLPKIPIERLSLTEELVLSIMNNTDYLILGCYHNSVLVGYVILHSGGNLEHIGFIRDIYIETTQLESIRQAVGIYLFNSALNAFADYGFNKAVFWNEIKDTDTSKLLEKYGFSKYGNEIIIYTRNSQV